MFHCAPYISYTLFLYLLSLCLFMLHFWAFYSKLYSNFIFSLAISTLLLNVSCALNLSYCMFSVIKFPFDSFLLIVSSSLLEYLNILTTFIVLDHSNMWISWRPISTVWLSSFSIACLFFYCTLFTMYEKTVEEIWISGSCFLLLMRIWFCFCEAVMAGALSALPVRYWAVSNLYFSHSEVCTICHSPLFLN